MKTITLDLDYSLNGGVLYAAGVPHPHTAHLQSLLDAGIAGTVADDEPHTDAGEQTSAQPADTPAADTAAADTPTADTPAQ